MLAAASAAMSAALAARWRQTAIIETVRTTLVIVPRTRIAESVRMVADPVSSEHGSRAVTVHLPVIFMNYREWRCIGFFPISPSVPWRTL